MAFVVDTHALIWFLEGGEKLGSRAREILSTTDEVLIIPSIALGEAKYIVQRRRTALHFEEIVVVTEEDPRVFVYPLNLRIVELMPEELEIHDAIIAATALAVQESGREQISIITVDRAIEGWGRVSCVW